jgi:metal-responsive CopG/Arc/MetJ family transcriptional regulator
MRRTLLLNKDDLILVVKDDIVKQIDEHRGEMNRSEFVNYLIQYQLKERQNQKNGISREEFQHFSRQMTDLLHNFLQFFVSYGMNMGKNPNNLDIQLLNKQLESFLKIDEDFEES